jgi:hypothetical protein
MLLSVSIFSASLPALASKLESTEDSEPIANEKPTTPIMRSKIAKSYSRAVLTVMSPYPMVVTITVV